MVSKKRLDELKVIFKEEYKVEFTDEEIFEIGSNLVDYFKALHDVYVSNYDEVQKIVKEKNLKKKN